MADARDNRRAVTGTFDLPPRIVMTDEDRLPASESLIASLPPGTAVVVRNRDPGLALAAARSLHRLAVRRGVLLSVALSAPPRRPPGVDGIHIPERSLANWSLADLQRLRPQFVTSSAHGRRAAWRGWRTGVDAVLLSPVLPTASHPDAVALGLMRFAAIANKLPLPVYALGGVSARDIPRVMNAGAFGVAGITQFIAANRPPEK